MFEAREVYDAASPVRVVCVTEVDDKVNVTCPVQIAIDLVIAILNY